MDRRSLLKNGVIVLPAGQGGSYFEIDVPLRQREITIDIPSGRTIKVKNGKARGWIRYLMPFELKTILEEELSHHVATV